MTRIVGIVPVVGREPLAHQTFGSGPLVERAISLIQPSCTSVAVVYGESFKQEPSHDSSVTVVTLPRDRAILVEFLASASQVLLHDPLCPLVPTSFVDDLVSRDSDRTWVGTRPVVDTVKATDGQAITKTVDRETLRVVCSPILVPARGLDAVGWGVEELSDFAMMVSLLRRSGPVELIDAPSASRRVEDVSGLELMESIDAVSHRTRER